MNVDIPLNVDLYCPKEPPKNIGQVKSLKIFDGISKNYQDDGLFSTSIFGMVGSKERDVRFGVIDLKVEILHPKIVYCLEAIRTLYVGILSGSEYAKWDPELKDFVPSNEMEGDTGFYFFMRYFKDIVFKQTGSDTRKDNIALIDKYRENGVLSYWLVGPAGMRDIEIIDESRIQKDEINDYYYSMIANANTVDHISMKNNPRSLDQIRWVLQKNALSIYDYVTDTVISGKGGFLLKRYASVGVQQATRNVITAMDTEVTDLDSPGNIKADQTAVGIYQYAVGCVDLVIHYLLNGFLKKVFNTGSNEVYLTEKGSLKASKVKISQSVYEGWTSREGMRNLVYGLGEIYERDQPLEVDGMYLGLCYLSPESKVKPMTFKFFQSIDELPPEFDAKDVKPITLAMLIYASIYKTTDRTVMAQTRFPSLNMSSTYASKPYLMTTLKANARYELNNNWDIPEGAEPLWQFPTQAPYFDSMAVQPAKLVVLSGDHDGDKMNAYFLMANESVDEVHKLLLSRRGYVGNDGNLISSFVTALSSLTLKNFTGE